MCAQVLLKVDLFNNTFHDPAQDARVALEIFLLHLNKGTSVLNQARKSMAEARENHVFPDRVEHECDKRTCHFKFNKKQCKCGQPTADNLSIDTNAIATFVLGENYLQSSTR